MSVLSGKAAKNDKIYLVEWQDAHSSPGWHDPKELKRYIEKERCICVNVGWILSETKDEIVMASRKFKIQMDGEMHYGLLEKIPKTWIRRKVIYKRGI